jgi:hypothetical protein
VEPLGYVRHAAQTFSRLEHRQDAPLLILRDPEDLQVLEINVLLYRVTHQHAQGVGMDGVKLDCAGPAVLGLEPLAQLARAFEWPGRRSRRRLFVACSRSRTSLVMDTRSAAVNATSWLSNHLLQTYMVSATSMTG